MTRKMGGGRMRTSIGLVGALAILCSLFVLWRNAGSTGEQASRDSVAAAPQGPVEDASPGSEGAGDLSVEPSVERSEVGSADLPTERSDLVLVRGRVLGPDRRPVAGAALSVGFWSSEVRQAVSAADGSFSAACPPPADGAGLLSTVARFEGRVGSRRTAVGAGEVEVEVGAVVLAPTHGLRVRVIQDGAPVAAAMVRLERSDRIVRLATELTEVNGEVFFEAAPERNLSVTARKDDASGTVRAVPPGDAEVTIELTRDRDYEIRVADAEDGRSIAGAAVLVNLEYWVAAEESPQSFMTGEFVMSRPDATRATTTDESGVAWVRGVSPWVSISVQIEAEGYQDSPRPVRLQDDPLVRVPLRRSALRTVRWPVTAGEVARPPSGAELEIRFVPGMVEFDQIHTAPGPGFMERGQVVLPGVEGRALFYATAPDGAIAKISCASDASLGEPVSFRRLRTLEVTVRDASGLPVEGARVMARNQGNNQLHAPVTTDSDGVGLISNLYGGLVTVHVAAPGETGRGHPCGSVDLEQGQGRIEATLLERARVRMRFQMDGVAGLPSDYRIHTRSGCTVEHEDPERAELLVSTPVDSGFQGETRFYIRARGFLGRSVEATLNAGQQVASVDVELIRAGTLLVDVLRDPGGSVQVGLERFEPQTDTYRRAGGDQLVPSGPGGSFRFTNLESGSYRAIDRRSQRTSALVPVVGGRSPARITLDVGNAQWVSGRVITPYDVSPREVSILVESEGGRSNMLPFLQGSRRPGQYVVREDGSFRVRIPGNRPVTISPWHPRLQPAPQGGLAVTTLGLEGVELRLVDQAGVVIPAPQLVQLVRGVRGVRVGVAAPGDPLVRWFHAAYGDGAIRFGTRPPHGLAPGRHTITLDPGSRFAPLVLREVEIREDLTELDPVTFEAGSTIRVRILTREGTGTRRIYVRAERREKPHYVRGVNSQGERVVELTGLGAGRYEVLVRAIENAGRRLEQEVTVDGKTDLTLTIDFR